MTDQTPQPGFYPDAQGTMRFWDGARWTEHTQTAPAATPAPPQQPSYAAPAAPGATVVDRPWFKKKRFIIPGAILALVVVGSAIGAGGTASSPGSESTVTSGQVEAAPSDAEDAPAEEPVEQEPELTAGQENAIGAAENYLDFAAFSRKGLVKQLKFDKYSRADAVFAVDHIDVSWKQQAAKSAENYLDLTSFSRDGLITQLEFDGFTNGQARYGAEKAGL